MLNNKHQSIFRHTFTLSALLFESQPRSDGSDTYVTATAESIRGNVLQLLVVTSLSACRVFETPWWTQNRLTCWINQHTVAMAARADGVFLMQRWACTDSAIIKSTFIYLSVLIRKLMKTGIRQWINIHVICWVTPTHTSWLSRSVRLCMGTS